MGTMGTLWNLEHGSRFLRLQDVEEKDNGTYSNAEHLDFYDLAMEKQWLLLNPYHKRSTHKKAFLLILFIFSYFLRTSTLLSALRCPQSSPFTKPETNPPLRVKILTFHCKYSFYLWKRMHCSGPAFTKW